jgi:hypothetical protein
MHVIDTRTLHIHLTLYDTLYTAPLEKFQCRGCSPNLLFQLVRSTSFVRFVSINFGLRNTFVEE